MNPLQDKIRAAILYYDSRGWDWLNLVRYFLQENSNASQDS